MIRVRLCSVYLNICGISSCRGIFNSRGQCWIDTNTLHLLDRVELSSSPGWWAEHYHQNEPSSKDSMFYVLVPALRISEFLRSYWAERLEKWWERRWSWSRPCLADTQVCGLGVGEVEGGVTVLIPRCFLKTFLLKYSDVKKSSDWTRILRVTSGFNV